MKISLRIWLQSVIILILLGITQGCIPHYYKLKEHKINKRPVDLLISDQLPTKYVFLHMGENYWRINDFRYDGDTITGKIEQADETVYQYYLEAKKMKTLKIKKNSDEETSVHQLHLFTDELYIENNSLKACTNKLTAIQTISKKKGLRALIYSSIALPSAVAIYFLVAIMSMGD